MNNESAAYYTRLYLAVHGDVALHSTYNPANAIQDVLRIGDYLRKFGFRFFTEVLPTIGKALDSALALKQPFEQALIDTEPESCIPVLYGDVFRRVLLPDGSIRSDADPDAVASLRQLAYLYYKLELPYTNDQKTKVLADFVMVDRGLADLDFIDSAGPFGACLDIASKLACRVFGTLDPWAIRPSHGPGAVATGEKSWEKKIFKRYYRQLAAFYPYESYFHVGLSHFCDDLNYYLHMPELDWGTAKVVLVPKDSRGPRLISCEPLEYQWIQQGLARAIVSRLEAHPATSGRINFSDQTVNRKLALESSVSQKWATLDMKEASDRVSNQLVFAVFGRLPVLLRALMSSRTLATRLPNGEIVNLNKFAPMGSALCFPVESFIFWAVSVAALCVFGKYGLKAAMDRVYVYGDDIIVRLEDHETVTKALERVGLLVNQTKSCTAGFFRESCGMDAYKGVDVTPVKIRKLYHPNLPECLASWSAYQQAFDKRHYYETSGFLQRELLSQGLHYLEEYYSDRDLQRLDDIREWDLPQTGIGLVSYIRPGGWELYKPYQRRWNHKFQYRWEVKAPILASVDRKVHIRDNDWREVLRMINAESSWVGAGRYSVSKDWREILHIISGGETRIRAGRYPVRRQVTLKRRWLSAI